MLSVLTKHFLHIYRRYRSWQKYEHLLRFVLVMIAVFGIIQTSDI